MTVATCDVLIIGAGAAGLSAAIASRLVGLDALLVEKHSLFGGSTARSGGMLWIPCNHLSVADGVEDSLDNALLYMRHEAGCLFEPARSEAYLRQAPRMIKAYEERTSAMRFIRSDSVGDNHPNLPGATERGRVLTVPPFDGRLLGEQLRALAPPMSELTFLGMQIRPGAELNHFFNAVHSWRSRRFVLKKLLAHARDLITYGRTTHLANGNALAARLAKSAFDLGARLWLQASVRSLSMQDGRVIGAIVERESLPLEVSAKRGVIIATGGFPHDVQRRTELSGQTVLDAIYPLAPETNVGDGLRLGESVGGQVDDRLENWISWTPVSQVPRGSRTELFPHGYDRCKPGVISVTRRGRRFTNEAVVGSDFIRAMAHECPDKPIEGFLIADHRSLRRYGLGVVRPWPAPLGQHLRSGYLKRGATVAQLARRAGIDAAALEQTITEFNLYAQRGTDPLFGRGSAALERRNGDSQVKPNPCVAPLSRAPFYAVKIVPGDFSTLAGLRTDHFARVLDANGRPIAGLYAAGNDSTTMFGGTSPAGGATLGPALTFGFIAASHIADAHTDESRETTTRESLYSRKH